MRRLLPRDNCIGLPTQLPTMKWKLIQSLPTSDYQPLANHHPFAHYGLKENQNNNDDAEGVCQQRRPPNFH